jgi:hypothetical protein
LGVSVTASPDGAAALGGEAADVASDAAPGGVPAEAVLADPIWSDNPGDRE